MFTLLKSLLSPEEAIAHVKSELRSFVDVSFEKLVQQWLVAQAFTGEMSLTVGAVAINYQSREINTVGLAQVGSRKG